MTEQEWLACADPKPMLEFLRGTSQGRKLRLFACACCRRVWPNLIDTRSRAALEALESESDDPRSCLFEFNAEASFRAAEGTYPAVAAAVASGANPALASRHAAWAVLRIADGVTIVPARTSLSKVVSAAGSVVESAEGRWGGPPPVTADDGELLVQSNLLRDIFGNPFRPVTFSPSWRTDTAVALARQMYESRDFSAMPILADALQDAGCADDDILNHCRSGGVHVRGCWVIDGVLGKG